MRFIWTGENFPKKKKKPSSERKASFSRVWWKYWFYVRTVKYLSAVCVCACARVRTRACETESGTDSMLPCVHRDCALIVCDKEMRLSAWESGGWQRTSEDISVLRAHQHTMFYSKWTRPSKTAAVPTQSVHLMTNNAGRGREIADCAECQHSPWENVRDNCCQKLNVPPSTLSGVSWNYQPWWKLMMQHLTTAWQPNLHTQLHTHVRGWDSITLTHADVSLLPLPHCESSPPVRRWPATGWIAVGRPRLTPLFYHIIEY